MTPFMEDPDCKNIFKHKYYFLGCRWVHLPLLARASQGRRPNSRRTQLSHLLPGPNHLSRQLFDKAILIFKYEQIAVFSKNRSSFVLTVALKNGWSLQLCAGAPDKLREQLQLAPPSAFHYLNRCQFHIYRWNYSRIVDHFIKKPV